MGTKARGERTSLKEDTDVSARTATAVEAGQAARVGAHLEAGGSSQRRALRRAAPPARMRADPTADARHPPHTEAGA